MSDLSRLVLPGGPATARHPSPWEGPCEDGRSKLTTLAGQKTDVYGAPAGFAELKLRVSEKRNSKNNRLHDVVVIENIYWSLQ